MANNGEELPPLPNHLVPVAYAYHVVNVKAEEPQPLFDKLKWHPANDSTYDGKLVGLPCVFFTTTLWKGRLPNNSPYPAHAVVGEFHWRVRIPLSSFEVYDGIWLVEKIQHPQIRIVLTKGEYEREIIRDITGIRELNKANNDYLCFRNGQWYTNDYSKYSAEYDPKKSNKFINFVVFHDFPLNCYCVQSDPPAPCAHSIQWDTVVRNDKGPGKPETTTKVLMNQWRVCKLSPLTLEELLEKNTALISNLVDIRSQYDQKVKECEVLKRQLLSIPEKYANSESDKQSSEAPESSEDKTIKCHVDEISQMTMMLSSNSIQDKKLNADKCQ